MAQSFNSVGALVTPIIGAAFILSGVEHTKGQIAAMSPEQFQAYQAVEAGMVRVPYLVITGIFLAVAAMIYFAKLPTITEGTARPAEKAGFAGVWEHPHLVKGVIAQFFYVGAQVGVASFVIRFSQYMLADTPEKAAANFLKYHLLGFMLGRFGGSAAMKVFSPPRMLAAFALGSLVCATLALTGSGSDAVWAIVLLGFFHSIMFPTIFALSLKDLGPLTKLGSSLLVMSIIGGAIVPAVMGSISDISNIQRAFLVPLVCYVYVLYFAVWGYRPMRLAAVSNTRDAVAAG